MASEDGQPRTLQIGGLTLDAAKQVVQLRGRSVQLGRRETVVLRVLIEAGGRPVDAQALFKLSWGCEPGDRVSRVRGVIGRLRAKLRSDDLIETIGREGYRIAARP